jgi:hypothetical protein
MIHLMRRIGMNAFQTVLLPQLSAGEIQRLNHADMGMLSSDQIPLLPEIQGDRGVGTSHCRFKAESAPRGRLDRGNAQPPAME